MAVGSTYTPIATTTTSGSSYTFSSIPSTYTDLVVVFSGTNASNTGIQFTLNSDTGSNYSYTQIYGDGTSAASNRNTTYSSYAYIGTSQSVAIFQFMNYSNTSTYKTTLYRGNNPGSAVNAGVGLWRSTSAINQIAFTTFAGGNFSNTQITLYGIQAA